MAVAGNSPTRCSASRRRGGPRAIHISGLSTRSLWGCARSVRHPDQESASKPTYGRLQHLIALRRCRLGRGRSRMGRRHLCDQRSHRTNARQASSYRGTLDVVVDAITAERQTTCVWIASNFDGGHGVKSARIELDNVDNLQMSGERLRLSGCNGRALAASLRGQLSASAAQDLPRPTQRPRRRSVGDAALDRVQKREKLR